MKSGKKYIIKSYLDNRDKDVSHEMTYEEVYNWVRKNPKEEITIMDANDLSIEYPKSKF